MTENDKPYEILSPTRIKVSEDVRWAAKEAGMTLNEMAEYLLRKHKAREN
jgi:hypothetical protein